MVLCFNFNFCIFIITVDLCLFIFYLANLLNTLILELSFYSIIYFVDFSAYIIMSSTNRENFNSTL